MQLSHMRGLWRHYKGKLYCVTGVAIGAGNSLDGDLLVLYHQEGNTESVYARRLDEFLGPVIGTDGKTINRFTREVLPKALY